MWLSRIDDVSVLSLAGVSLIIETFRCGDMAGNKLRMSLLNQSLARINTSIKNCFWAVLRSGFGS